MAQYWLMKSEPNVFSINDLSAAPQQTTRWDGVRNYQARNYLRQMQLGDLAFFYHSNAKSREIGIVGVMEIAQCAYPDPTAWDKTSAYFDPNSPELQPRWSAVDCRLRCAFSGCLTLAELHAHAAELGEFQLLKKGNRLSVMPVTVDQWHWLYSCAQKRGLLPEK